MTLNTCREHPISKDNPRCSWIEESTVTE